MIPVLFSNYVRDFTTNGLGRLADAISCQVTEERNGVFELEMVYPCNGVLYEEIAIGSIIYVSAGSQNGAQPFEVYRISKPIDGKVTFNAWHISYRLNSLVCAPFHIVANTPADVFEAIKSNTTDCYFTFTQDGYTPVARSFDVGTPKSVRDVLGGSRGSVLDSFGGEFSFNNFNVQINKERGADRGVTIRYGVSMTGMKDDIDATSVYTGGYGYWTDLETGSVMYGGPYLVEGTRLYEPWTDDKNNVITTRPANVQIDFGYQPTKHRAIDLSEYFDTAPTEAQMQAKVLSILADEAFPKESFEVDYVDVKYQVNLCDSISMVHPKLDVETKLKVVRVVYDSLLERNISITLGELKPTLGEAISDPLMSSLAIVTNEVKENTRAITRVVETMDDAIENATDLITGVYGGYVVINRDEDGQPYEILIMNLPEKERATKVIRMNQNGIAFGTSYNGPFTTAWTIDGKFYADWITAGTMSADRIRGGRIEANTGVSFWDMNSGDFENFVTDNVGVRIHDGVIDLIRETTSGQRALLARLRGNYYVDGLDGLGVMGRSFSITDTNGTLGFRVVHGSDGWRTSSRGSVIIRRNASTSGGAYLGYDDADNWFKVSSDRGLVLEAGENRTRAISIDQYGSIRFDQFCNFGGADFSQFTEFSGTVRFQQAVTFNGYVTFNGGHNISSDERLKRIEDWDDRHNGLIDLLEPIIYSWKGQEARHVGFSAQKTQKALEDLGIKESGIVSKNEDGYLGISYTDIIPLLVKKVQDQEKKISVLEARLSAIERRIIEDADK